MFWFVLIGVIALEVLALVGHIIRINLPAWRDTPGQFRKDLKETLFFGYMIWLFVGAIATIFLFIAPATQAEFNVGKDYFLAYLVSCVPMVALV